jgi:multidrug efflux pump subunit AcrA (membrane-fusion protein)
MQQRQIELKIAEAERAAAEANLHAAELNVQRCSVTAPFAGVVLARLVAEGEWVAAGTAVVTLLDSQRLELSAQIGVDEVKGLRQARLLEFVAEGQRYPVTLRAMPERIDPQLRQREARLSFNGKGALPGQSGRLEWQSGVAHLPADLPVRRDGRLGLFVVEQGKARFVVLPDAIEGRPVSAAALPAKAVVVIEGRQSLRDGDAVTVVQSR